LSFRKSSGVRIVSRSGVLLYAVTASFQFCQSRDQRPDRKWVAQKLSASAQNPPMPRAQGSIDSL
jgi:hypothetical protein